MSRFNHEKLIVYQKAIALVSDVETILSGTTKKLAARDQLRRAIMSIPINIAEANATFGDGASVHLIEIAIGSALESAAAFDVLRVREACDTASCDAPKTELSQIVGMLYGLREAKSNPGRLRENSVETDTVEEGGSFDHERLDVYQMALDGVRFGIGFETKISSSLFKGYDRASTSVVLNIAEGNGRFAKLDRGRFLDIAKRSLLQAVAVLDVAAARGEVGAEDVDPVKVAYSSVFRMIEGLRQSVLSREEEGGETKSEIRSKARGSVKYS